MTNIPRERPDIDDPDPDPMTREDNSEQDDEGSQAQDVAADALGQPYPTRENVETEHGGRSDPTQLIPDDVQDVVDHMTDMDRSGRIDMDAFDGEDNMDDEDGSVPETGEPSRRAE